MSGRSSDKSGPTGRSKRNGDRLRLVGARVGAAAWILALLGAAAALAWAVPELEATSAARTPHIEIEFVDPPAWLDAALSDHLNAIVRSRVTGRVVDQASLEDARAALVQTGWFEQVKQVRWSEEDCISITADFVRPFALVRDGEADHLVDTAARLLPCSYDSGRKSEGWVVVTGARFNRPPQPGLVWEGADVAAAIAFLRQIDQQAWKQQIVEVDVSRYLSDHALVLATDRARIFWGSAPGDEQALEPPLVTKLKYLTYHFTQFGRIDRGLNGELVISPYGMSLRR